MSPAIAARGLTKAFGATAVLRGVDLTVAAGEVVAIIGPSGSGKSTLLRCVAGLEAYDGGTLSVAGSVGFVFQGFNLFPHMTALQNVTLAPRKVRKVPAATARIEGLALLEKVGLGDKADAYPGEMSGGQQQRCAIARALAMTPDVMLFDEPTSALDPELVAEVLAVIAALAAEGRTLAIVTHQMAFAREVASRTLFMDEGVVVEEGPSAALFAAPGTQRLRRFLDRVV